MFNSNWVTASKMLDILKIPKHFCQEQDQKLTFFLHKPS